jgi:hypothetical protein
MPAVNDDPENADEPLDANADPNTTVVKLTVFEAALIVRALFLNLGYETVGDGRASELTVNRYRTLLNKFKNAY